MTGAVLEVQELHKTFHLGFFRRPVPAVRGISFEVRRGEIFGLLGPNGAGKTTTIKMVLRLIFADRGSIRIFSEPTPTRAAMARLGYLPENPYVYQYLKPLEFLDLCGRLTGMDKKARAERGRELIERVGLTSAIERPIGKFSKGMMQRIGIAQALLHRPELLILDEPMSGLDPIGRKDVRDLIVEQRERGTTILFTSHILSDVELLCDRVGIMNRGRMSHSGKLDELLRSERRVEVELADVNNELREKLAAIAIAVEGRDRVQVTVSDEGTRAVLELALAAGSRVLAVTPSRESLEDLFVRDALSENAPS